MIKLLRLFLMLFFVPVILSAQELKIKSIGIPFMESYGASDFQSSSQNFDVLVGDDGKVYFANFNRVLIFNGKEWVWVNLTDKNSAYSLAKTTDGTIYVGGVNEIGYLETTRNGELKYISLNHKLPDELRTNFTSWKAYSLEEKIVFATTDHLFIVEHKSKDLTAISCPLAYWTMSVSQNKIFSYRSDSLFQLKNDAWIALRQSNLYVYPTSIKVIVVDVDTKTIAINDRGFFDFDSDEKIQIDPRVENFLSSKTLKNVAVLKNKYIALSTYNGLLITDINGTLIQYLNKEKGLASNLIYQVVVDDSDMMWAATNSGVNKVEIFSAYSLIDQRMGLDGVINDVAFFYDKLYASTFSGVYYSKMSNFNNPLELVKFDKMAGNVSWDFIKRENELISLTSSNAYVIRSDNYVKIDATGAEVYWEGISLTNSNDLLFGSESGILLHIIPDGDFWKVKQKHSKNFPGIHNIAQANDTTIWIGNRDFGFYKVIYDFDRYEIKNIEHYDARHGLPSNNGNNIFPMKNGFVFTTQQGVYIYDEKTNRFKPDSSYLETVGSKQIHKWNQGRTGDIYYNAADGMHILKNDKAGVKKIDLPKSKLEDHVVLHIEPVDSMNVMVTTHDAILHINPILKLTNEDKFDVNYTKLSLISEKDSLLYGGFGAIPKQVKLDYSKAVFRAEFSSSFFDDPKKTVYKWRLKGYDEGWSQWSKETQKDYTNLAHGEYIFEVVAKNVYGIESNPAKFGLLILPPWYHTIWAYLVYALGFVIFMRIAFKLNSKRLEKENQRLEAIVKDRTEIITIQKEKAEKDAETISQQHDKLLQMDELKSRFFLNISHELRTPLTLTMGTVDQTIKGRFGSLNDEQYANLKVSYRNSERLLKMVNNILDISKLEGGKIQLYTSKIKPSEVLEKVVAFFSSKFHDKKIEFRSDIKSDVEIYIDKDKFETVFINLIANAFKFTPDGGEIALSMHEEKELVRFVVKDNGIGIPTGDIPFVFDRFYQSPHTKSGEGTGVGLALSKELVELHKGAINVESSVKLGTVFTLTFKKGKNHLSADQIVNANSEIAIKPLDEKYPLTDNLFKKDELQNDSKITNQTSEKQHILIVEDNYEMRKFLNQILSEDYQTSMVENGEEGVQFLEKTKVDLILTDYLMPVMDGFEMATEIKKNEELALIPMVFLTARAQEQDKINVLNMGVDDYLFKPFNAEELKVRISNLLRAKQQRAEYWVEKSIDPRDIEWKEFPSKLKLDIDKYIQEHIKEEITIQNLTEFTGQSERSLFRKVKVNTGLSLMQYIKEYRLRKARTLLESKDVLSVSDAAYAVGLNHLSHFTKSFKERFGKNPSEYLD